MTAPAVRRIHNRSTFRALRRPLSRATRGPLRVSYVPDTNPVGGAYPQVGYTIGRRCGNAVTRNRLRRRLRAAVAELAPELRPGSYLLGASAAATGLGSAELRRTCREVLLAAAKPDPLVAP